MPERPKDETVIAKTGRSWDEWFVLLDEFDCKTQGHRTTARWLKEEHRLGSWWAQAVTVQYELNRGIREPGQRYGGKFAINLTRTISAPLEKTWSAWADAAELCKWFTSDAKQDFREGGAYSNGDSDRGTFTRIIPNARIQFTWENEKHCPGSMVILEFFQRGPEKTTLAITHDSLPSKKGADDMKDGWSWALDCLKSYLETGSRIGYEEWSKAKTG
jgi:uncharacterized protein YndB with AHSA1/START domain